MDELGLGAAIVEALPMPNKNVGVSFSEEEIALLESHPNFVKPRPGVSGGYGGLVRQIVREYFGLEPAIPYHDLMAEEWAKYREKWGD